MLCMQCSSRVLPIGAGPHVKEKAGRVLKEKGVGDHLAGDICHWVGVLQ
jgi:hypothetical protein